MINESEKGSVTFPTTATTNQFSKYLAAQAKRNKEKKQQQADLLKLIFIRLSV